MHYSNITSTSSAITTTVNNSVSSENYYGKNGTQSSQQQYHIKRLRLYYESALELLHIRGNRRVVPLVAEETCQEEQSTIIDPHSTTTVTGKIHTDVVDRHGSTHRSNNVTILPEKYTEPSASNLSFTSTCSFTTRTTPKKRNHHHRQKEKHTVLDDDEHHKKATTPLPTSSSTNGILNKVLTRTISTSKSLVSLASSSEKSSSHYYFTKLQQKHVRIYIKAPHYAAGGQVSGVVVVNLPQQQSHSSYGSPLSSDPLDGIESFTFQLLGIEEIHDQANYTPATHTHQFLEVPIFHYGQDVLAACYNHGGMIKIPFVLQLPVDLGASYADKKARVRYVLQTEMALDCPTLPTMGGYATSSTRPLQRIIKTERAIVIYPNVMSSPLSDATLYMPTHETRHIWQSPVLASTCSVELHVLLSRTIWIAGTPMYMGFKIHNMSKQKIANIKLELLRRQNTFSQTGLEGSFGLMPVTSTCEVVTRVDAYSFDWWQPIEQGLSDQITLSIQSPMDHFSIRNQKLIDVSYSIRVSIASTTSTDAVLEVPVILVHPISMDPPPGNYLQGDQSNDCKDAYRRLCVNIFRETTPHSNSSSQSDVPSLEHTITSTTKSTSTFTKSIASASSSIRRPFRRMRRNISQWLSNHYLTQHNHNKRKRLMITATKPTSTTTLATTTHRSLSSPVRHGNVPSPKQFGAHPDSIGDAGLDIRHKLNVATAREAWEGYTAEQCSIPRVSLVSPTPERSISLPSRWKAPSEKFEIGSSFNLRDIQQHQEGKSRSSTMSHQPQQQSRYPLNAHKGIKRMLASSRYMKSLQSKTLSVTEDGRKLLALSTTIMQQQDNKHERRSAIAI